MADGGARKAASSPLHTRVSLRNGGSAAPLGPSENMSIAEVVPTLKRDVLLNTCIALASWSTSDKANCIALGLNNQTY